MPAEKKTIKIGSKEIPLTAKGLPNRVYLSKDEKEIVDKLIAEKKQAKKEIMINDLRDAFKNIKI